jgi:hypothetical protein
MKKSHLLITALYLLGLTSNVFGQAKKPTLMILPSDNWCEQRFFRSTVE